jgi:aminoglycoside 6'-N-acetyltransferase
LSLQGPRVRIVPVGAEHRERLDELRAVPEIRRWWQDPWGDWLAEEADTSKCAVLLDEQLIGYVQWYEEGSSPMYRHAGVDLFLDPAFHGQGLGTEVVRVVCAHLIDEHDFHRIVIDPEVANEVAIACYGKVGFRPVGVMRRYQRDRFGEWQDGLLMDLLAEEFVRG